MAKALATSLRLVESPDEIRANVTRFRRELAQFHDQAQTLARQTWYWVYDSDTGTFGPSKFVGFAGMSFRLRENALTRKVKGVEFHGGLTRRAVEKALTKPYKRELALVGKLKQSGSKMFGPGVFDGVDQAKWRVVRLDGKGTAGEWVEEAVLEAVELAQSKSGGQGFGLTKEERKAIEKHAMDRVIQVLEKQGYQVDDVSSNSPYDLCCRQDGKVKLCVEVNGTKGLAKRVFLTSGEVRFAQANPAQAMLMIVHSITVNQAQKPTASGGIVKTLFPWKIRQDALAPIAYEYRLSTKD
jgi:hypothetical protein